MTLQLQRTLTPMQLLKSVTVVLVPYILCSDLKSIRKALRCRKASSFQDKSLRRKKNLLF